MAPTLTYDQLIALNPCEDSLKRVVKMLGGPHKWGGNGIDAATARAAGVGFYDMLWVLSAKARSDEDVERRLRLLLADYAARVLPIFEREVRNDDRPRAAIIATRQFARGEIDDAAAGAAAGDAAGAAAGAAAGDAWVAACAARDAAWAAAWAAAGDAWAAEQAWQFDRLIARMSDNDPADWPLDAAP